MTFSRGVPLFLVLICLSFLNAQTAQISQRLDAALQEASSSQTMVKAYVMLRDQVDVTALDKSLYEENASLKDRVYIVVTSLQQKAVESQDAILAMLNERPANEIESITSLWIVNMLMLEARAEVYYDLMSHQDIELMDIVPEPNWEKPVAEGPAPASIPNGVEPGIEAINARKMWEQGYDGTGRLVMGIDSGVHGNHPAVTWKWRGNSVPSSEAWFGSGSFPNDCDGGSHGTHTIGTMTGLDPATADTIGVAPGAEWIASGALCGNVTRIQAFQWAMDPDGNPATIADVPDAIGCSWWDPNGGVCASNIYINVLDALEAAGIAVIFSAGNSGPGTSTITRPKNTNTTLVNFWATGALNGNDPNLPIANFSSRGPSTCGGTGSLLIKPEASAPGVSVRSATGSSGYGTKNGTSMAAPHVVGAIALLRQAFPNKTGYELKLALLNTARDLGIPGEDNDYGTGIIDVWAAFLSMAGPLGAQNFTAYSDYQQPDQIQLNWTDPETVASGDSLASGTYTMMLFRDGELLDSVASDIESYLDTGLNPGTVYRYSLQARVDSIGLLGDIVSTQWTAGGARQPEAVSLFDVNGNDESVEISWINPSTNIDGTPLKDFAGVNVYQNGVLLTTLSRDTSSTGTTDSAVLQLSPRGYYAWQLTAIDNETPQNESAITQTEYVLLTPTFSESFDLPGEPSLGIWRSVNVDVNDRASSPPNGSYALNLNGTPVGSDTVEMRPVDLSGYDGLGLMLEYTYQPQGTGNAPEEGDSLRLYFKTDLDEWILVRGYPGTAVTPFEFERIMVDTVNTGSGSIFHDDFQLRFISMGGSGNFPNDDWFIGSFDFLPLPLGVEGEDDFLPVTYDVGANYPNPFNPTTTIDFQLPQRSDVVLVVYNTLGQKVRTLVNETVAAGMHSVIWDGKNEAGQGVASGIYLYRFETEDFQKIQKMILMK